MTKIRIKRVQQMRAGESTPRLQLVAIVTIRSLPTEGSTAQRGETGRAAGSMPTAAIVGDPLAWFMHALYLC
jgi:hypothetical protein